jgi:hypothetical protein
MQGAMTLKWILLALLSAGYASARLCVAPMAEFEPQSAPSGTIRPPLVNFQVKEPTLLARLKPQSTILLINHTFANSYGDPATIDYRAPSDAHEWTALVLEMAVTSIGTQYDRLGSLYLHHVEILRTSTAEPTPYGIEWTV